MARPLLPVAIGVLACIGRSSPALACDSTAARAGISDAWGAMAAWRTDDFFATAAALVGCPDNSPAERAEILRIQGAAAGLDHHTERAARLFSEARALDPLGTLPEAYFPPTHALAQLYRMSAPLLSQAPALESPSLDLSLPAALPPALPEVESRPRRAPLVFGAALSSVAAGGLWFASSMMDSRAELAAAEGLGQDPADAYAEQERYRGRQLGLQVAAGGSAALAVGLVGATVSLSW